MVPAAVVGLEAVPLTVNGKLDIRALPAPEYSGADRYRAPTTPVEEILAGIYARVLGVERVGVDDSFFDLGGDSLWAMRVVAAVQESLDAHLTVRHVFDAPAIAQLVRHVGGVGAGVGVGARCSAGVVPLSFAQRRLWFFDQLEGPSSIYNIALALRLGGQLDVGALGEAVADVVGRHESLRTVFPAAEGIPRQVVIARRAGRFRVGGHRCQRMDGDPVADAVDAAAGYTFDLATEIPVRARLFAVADQQHVLVIVLHHIAADGWSLSPAGALIWARPMAPACGAGPGLGRVGGAVCRLHVVAA